jgi:hypothetical protein
LHELEINVEFNCYDNLIASSPTTKEGLACRRRRSDQMCNRSIQDEIYSSEEELWVHNTFVAVEIYGFSEIF